MERVTGFLELLGVLLVLAAIGWQAAELAGVPLGLCSAAGAAWLSSWLLQGAPTRRRGRVGGERR